MDRSGLLLLRLVFFSYFLDYLLSIFVKIQKIIRNAYFNYNGCIDSSRKSKSYVILCIRDLRSPVSFKNVLENQMFCNCYLIQGLLKFKLEVNIIFLLSACMSVIMQLLVLQIMLYIT
jgi:hypothetical protein